MVWHKKLFATLFLDAYFFSSFISVYLSCTAHPAFMTFLLVHTLVFGSFCLWHTKIFKFYLGLSFDDAVLNFHSQNNLGRAFLMMLNAIAVCSATVICMKHADNFTIVLTYLLVVTHFVHVAGYAFFIPKELFDDQEGVDGENVDVVPDERAVAA